MHHSSALLARSPSNSQNNNKKSPQNPQRPPIRRICPSLFLLPLFLLLLISNCSSASISNNGTSSPQSTGPDPQLHQNAQNGQQHRLSNSAGGQNARFSHPLFEEQREEKNLFREYLSRGMFSCAEKYVGILQKLNKLIVSAHREYSQCQGQIAATAGRSAEESRKLAAQLEMINELFGDDQ